MHKPEGIPSSTTVKDREPVAPGQSTQPRKAWKTPSVITSTFDDTEANIGLGADLILLSS